MVSVFIIKLFKILLSLINKRMSERCTNPNLFQSSIFNEMETEAISTDTYINTTNPQINKVMQCLDSGSKFCAWEVGSIPTSNTFTPTFTDSNSSVTNLTTEGGFYFRIGNIVQFGFTVNMDYTNLNSGVGTFKYTLPIEPINNFVYTYNLTGVVSNASDPTISVNAFILEADTTSKKGKLTFNLTSSPASPSFSVMGIYNLSTMV